MWRLLLFSCLLQIEAEAQNLVPNSGFEEYYDCPTQIGQLHLAKHWFSANGGTPEYFNKACKSEWNKPHKGLGYSGLILFGQYPKIIEYIAVELSDALIEGEDYRISFQIRAETSPIYIDRIDLALLGEDPSIKHWSPLRLKPSLSHSGTILKNTEAWTEVSGIHTALGGERFLILGNFQFQANLLQEANPLITERKPGWYSYYLIDDVEVIPEKAELHEIPISAVTDVQKPDFILRPIQFDFDSFTILPSESRYLDALLEFTLLENKRISIIGYADSFGSESYNNTLSKNRVEGVFNYLSSRGLLGEALKMSFRGEKQPQASNSTADGRAKNRRVEISFIEP